MNFKDPYRSVGFLVSDLSRLMRRNFNRRLQSLGLTQAQWRAIAHLSRHEGMTQIALADALEVQAITLARLIDRMESAGWVERRNHPQDRRAVQLYLTSKCEPLLEEMHRRASETISEAMSGIGATEQKQLLETLHQMKANLAAAENATADNHEPRNGTNTDVGRKATKLYRAR